MRKILLAIILVGLLSLVGHAEGMDGEGLLSGWNDFKVSAVKTPNGAAYLGYIVGVLHGTYYNSATFDHLPDMRGAEVAVVVGMYLEKHKKDEGFNKAAAAKIIMVAILERFPPPRAKGKI